MAPARPWRLVPDGAETVCAVHSSRRCSPVTDGAHSRVGYVAGAWYRWLPTLGAWVPTTGGAR